MKYAKHTLMAAGLAAFAFPASAIEVPPDDAPPIEVPKIKVEAKDADKDAVPAVPVQPERKMAPGDAQLPAIQKAAYFGVGTAPVPELLGVHIGLKPGEGVWIRVLDPAGPANKAGFALNDVIVKIDGQPVGSQNDLTERVAARKPGDEVSIDLIHAGKAETRKVILGERSEDEIALNLPRNSPLDHLLQGMPQEQAKRFRDAIEHNLGGADGFPDLKADAGMPEIDQAMKEMQKRVEKMLEGGAAAAPPDVRRRVDALNLDMSFKGNGLRLQIGPHPDPVPDK